MNNERKYKIKIILYCFLISFVAITIASKNSFLYPFNNWVDENAFMTVAKAWDHGMIPYKDIFEHKGPMLYLIFRLGYLISNHTFIGIYFIELISLTISLYFVHKIIRLYLSEKYVYLILPLFTAVVVSSSFFVHGGSTEEFLYLILAYMLFSYLNYFKENNISNTSLFINGVGAGIVLVTKFNLLGFWFIFMSSIFILLIMSKKVKRAFISALIFLFGMFIPIFSFLLYFYLVHGLSDFISTYFIFNLTSYGEKISLIKKIINVFKIIYEQINYNFIIFNFIYLGFIYFIFSRKFIDKISYKILLIIMFIFGAFGIYYGLHKFPYYFYILTIFVIFGFISLFSMINLENSRNFKLSYILILLISTVLIFNSKNLSYIKNAKEDLVQYKFAKIINKTENARILNYGFGDGGFYMASNTFPSTKYFQNYNGLVIGMQEDLDEKIKNKFFDYIIIRKYKMADPVTDLVNKNYKEISEESEIL